MLSFTTKNVRQKMLFFVALVFFAVGTIQYAGERWIQGYARSIREHHYVHKGATYLQTFPWDVLVWSVPRDERVRLEAFRKRNERNNVEGAVNMLRERIIKQTARNMAQAHYDLGQTLLRVKPPQVIVAMGQFGACLRYDPDDFACKYDLEAMFSLLSYKVRKQRKGSPDSIGDTTNEGDEAVTEERGDKPGDGSKAGRGDGEKGI
jgi:hypothetical protein